MTQESVRDGKFDVVVVAGPRLEHWPSAGVRRLSLLCAEMGLTVGLYGGESLRVRGVIPLPGTGGIVLVEDVQGRLHRIQARAIVKVTAPPELPDPFPGWRSRGLIPLSTAQRLQRESRAPWDPCTVVLGSGNRALRFASSLLESGVPEVFCVEAVAQWGAKRFAGWEVERRRFEMAGGKLIEARPVSLVPKSALRWELRVEDSRGIRVLEVARVVSAGPFSDSPGVREHPPGSALYELEQSAPATRSDDIEGWAMEEERGKVLAGKIVKALVTELGPRREDFDSTYRRARGRVKRYQRHREEPFTPAYQGKWVSVSDARRMRAFRGVPQQDHRKRLVASVECFEDIPCNVCMQSCPVDAIEIGRVPRTKDSLLTESKCIACGICVAACPSGAIPMIQEREDQSLSRLTLPWRGGQAWTAGEFAQLLNRRGETLGSARVIKAEVPVLDQQGIPTDVKQLVELEVPTHLVWEARGLKRVRPPAADDSEFLSMVSRSEDQGEKVEITLNGERRLVRDKIPLTVALFENGQARSDDVLFCPDGSCGLCQVTVDGVKKLACETRVHRGMAVRLGNEPEDTAGEALCPCQGITSSQVLERIAHGQQASPEAVIAGTHVGGGRCHGQLCMGAFSRLLSGQGMEVSQWVDWRFPWSDWILTHN